MNRRVFYRTRMRLLDARATHVANGRARALTVHVLDLSGSGAHLRTPEPMQPGDMLRLQLPPRRGSKPIKVDAHVVRVVAVANGWDAGIEFLHLTDAARDRLIGLVFSEEQRRRRVHERFSLSGPPRDADLTSRG